MTARAVTAMHSVLRSGMAIMVDIVEEPAWICQCIDGDTLISIVDGESSLQRSSLVWKYVLASPYPFLASASYADYTIVDGSIGHHREHSRSHDEHCVASLSVCGV